MRRAAIICGFPGIGKTVLADQSRTVEDVESSPFHWQWEERVAEDGLNTVRVLPEPKEIPNWQGDYVDHINKISQNPSVSFVLVSSHRSVREEMIQRGLPYVIVLPFRECKDEYIARYLVRGSDAEFIQKMHLEWDKMIDDLENDGAPIIHLKPGMFLADLFPHIGHMWRW